MDIEVREIIRGKLFELTLPIGFVRNAALGEWTKSRKQDQYSKSDHISKSKATFDAKTGNIGEASADRLLKLMGIKTGGVDFGNLPQDSELWKKDIPLVNEIPLFCGRTRHLCNEITVKTQMKSMAKRTGLSWTFQDKTSGRFADPILSRPQAKTVVIACSVDDQLHGHPVDPLNCSKETSEGFEWKARIRFFYWPQVFELLSDPISTKLRGMKKCLYYRDQLKVNAQGIEQYMASIREPDAK